MQSFGPAQEKKEEEKTVNCKSNILILKATSIMHYRWLLIDADDGLNFGNLMYLRIMKVLMISKNQHFHTASVTNSNFPNLTTQMQSAPMSDRDPDPQFLTSFMASFLLFCFGSLLPLLAACLLLLESKISINYSVVLIIDIKITIYNITRQSWKTKDGSHNHKSYSMSKSWGEIFFTLAWRTLYQYTVFCSTVMKC